VPEEFDGAVHKILEIFPKRIDEYESLLTTNQLFLERTRHIGVISGADCISWGLSGPVLRGSGVAADIRKDRPYSGYEQYEFDIPIQTEGDIYSRYLVRVAEMRQSLRIIEQALKKLPGGAVRSDNRKVVPPPRSEIGVSMESLIHHFKLWTDGYPVPAGNVYTATESPKGELGVYMESDGTNKPLRVHYRTPSFIALQALPLMTRNRFVADVVGIIGSVDIVLGDADR